MATTTVGKRCLANKNSLLNNVPKLFKRATELDKSVSVVFTYLELIILCHRRPSKGRVSRGPTPEVEAYRGRECIVTNGYLFVHNAISKVVSSTENWLDSLVDKRPDKPSCHRSDKYGNRVRLW